MSTKNKFYVIGILVVFIISSLLGFFFGNMMFEKTNLQSLVINDSLVVNDSLPIAQSSDSGSGSSGEDLETLTQEYVDSIQNSISVEEIKKIALQNPDDIYLNDESFSQLIFKDKELNVAFLYQTCLAFDDRKRDFTSFFGAFYGVGEEDYKILNKFDGDDFCDSPINIGEEGFCETSFDREFLNNATRLYLGIGDSKDMLKYLQSIQTDDFQQEAYKDFFTKLIEGKISDISDCTK